MTTGASGRCSAMFKPFHLIGLELNVSILSVALDRRPTGAARDWRGDMAAVASRPLRAGETLDGEGGETVWGKLIPPSRSATRGACPIGLAQGARLTRDVAAGEIAPLSAVAPDPADPRLALRARMRPAA